MSDSTISQLNSFLNKAADAILCDTNCQKSKTSEELKKKYLDARLNLITAPNQVNTAARNYLTYSQGEAGFNEFNEARLEQISNQIASTFQGRFNEQITELNSEINTYDGLLINFTNVVDLYTNYVKENRKLEREVRETLSDVLTNDRKTYYQDQGISNLNGYYTFLLVIYVITVIVYLVSVFVFPSTMSITIKGVIFLFLLIYPFIASILLKWLISIYTIIVNILPKNVHRNI